MSLSHLLPPPTVPARRAGRKRQRQRRRAEVMRRVARLNHILIPDKKSERDRLRSRLPAKILGAGFAAYTHLSREGRAVLALCVPVGLAALDVRFSQVHLLFAILLGVLLGSWLCRPLFRVHGLRIDVSVAPRVSVGSPAHFDLTLKNQGSRSLTNLRVTAPFLPWDGRWQTTPIGLGVLEPKQRARLTAAAVFEARGEHHLDSFEIGQLVSTGLAVGPRFQSVGVRFLVVPRVAHVVSVGWEAAMAQQGDGIIAAPHRGETDIAGVRPYRSGDPLKHLHARTWARTGEPHVREFIDPQDEQVALIVMSGEPGATELQHEATLSLAAGVAAQLALHGRGLDVLACGAKRLPVSPRSGPAALDVALDRMATVELTASVAPLPAVSETLRHASCAVIVSAGFSTDLACLIDEARAGGLRCSWAVVVNSTEEMESPAPNGARILTIDDINSGRSIVL
jgi:uncharacterized protein (DUF58 family)